MPHKIISLAIGLMIGFFFFPTAAEGQSESLKTRNKVIKDQPQKLQKSSNRYIENNKTKKKFRAKRKVEGLWDCHPYLLYKSKPQKDREKMINKRRKKL